MAQTVLGSISLGYQFLWSPLRLPAAVRLFIDADPAQPVDAPHLLATLRELWSEQAPPLLLSVQSAPLFRDILAHGGADDPWIEVPGAWIADPDITEQLLQAQQRGAKLIWRGEPGQRPDASLAPCFHKLMLSLTPEEALQGLRVSVHLSNSSLPAAATPLQSPVLAGQIYEAVANRALVQHCLDQQFAWGVVGWPTEEVLHGYRNQLIQPSQRAILRLVQAIDDDASLDAIENGLTEEPVLAYRFLHHANSAGLGLRAEIDSIRRGLMVLGYATLKAWLLEQLPNASTDVDLDPIRTAMVIRARLMERLLDAGDEDNLRREVYLCGLLSHIDLLLAEPLATVLARLPLPERLYAALLQHAGPYAPYLDIASALESPHTRATLALCKASEISMEEVNRALLRTLAATPSHPPH